MTAGRAIVLLWLVALLVLVALAAHAQTGKASWYGPTGRPTASGAPFVPSAMTCAHRSLAFGTVVRVTRKDNGRAIRCKVTDRGPFKDGRIIDLSPAAARGLGLIHAGVLQVTVEVVDGRHQGNRTP